MNLHLNKYCYHNHVVDVWNILQLDVVSTCAFKVKSKNCYCNQGHSLVTKQLHYTIKYEYKTNITVKKRQSLVTQVNKIKSTLNIIKIKVLLYFTNKSKFQIGVNKFVIKR